jgi:hypothetical protein
MPHSPIPYRESLMADLEGGHHPARDIKHQPCESLKALGLTPPDRELP